MEKKKYKKTKDNRRVRRVNGDYSSEDSDVELVCYVRTVTFV